MHVHEREALTMTPLQIPSSRAAIGIGISAM